MKKLLVALLFVGGLILFGCLAPEATVDTKNAITKEMCQNAGGNWNSQTPACQCGGIAGFKCPPSYVCTDYSSKGAADAMGICKKGSE